LPLPNLHLVVLSFWSVPFLVSIKKRVGGRRPPWIGYKLCLDLNEIFQFISCCVLDFVVEKSEFGSFLVCSCWI
jgi:hypothetical protein